MIQYKNKVEKMEPSAEQKVKEVQEEEEEAEQGDDVGDEEEEEDGDNEDQEIGDDTEGEEEEEEEAAPQPEDKIEKSIPSPVKPKEKKPSEGLNLNNEVVKMRKEVKRTRALIIRKLTRQIGALKKKKGKEAEVERNQRRAARLLEEIHAIKTLSPDLVTKTALQKNLNFEQECRNPKSTISDRAIARIATHPQFNKKIEAIKAAVKAFKEERRKDAKQGGKEKVQNKSEKVTPQSPDKKIERQSEKEEEDITVEQKEIVGNDEEDGILKDITEATVAEPEKKMGKAPHSDDNADVQRKELAKNVQPTPVKSSGVKEIVKNKPQSKDVEKKPDLKSVPEVLQKDEEESDLDLSDDEEKEYFDDSTEERFHKQSSQSEDSDDDNGFFIGKVNKFKKKKQKSVGGDKVEKVPAVKTGPTDEVQSKLDELESRLKSKTTSLQSVFCSTLSASKPGGGRGAGRGRGGDKFRGRGRGGGGLNRDFGKQSKFQRQEKETETNSGSKFKSSQGKSDLPQKGFPTDGRGRGRGRGVDRRGGGVFAHQAPQQALHPSWEASKKRKEQQGQIMAFQGKKIKFDDDD